MRRSFKFVCAALGIALLASQATAARLYITQSNAIPGGGAPKAGVPNITLTPGEMTDLYVWVDLSSDGDGGDGPDQFMAGYGLDLLATDAGVIEAVSSDFFNPTLTAFGNPFQPRWSGGHGQPAINPNGAGAAELAINARGFSVNPSGAAGIYANGVSVPPGGFFPVGDPLYDATNNVWLAQHLKIMARDTGPGLHTTGIQMRVGANAFSIDNNPGTEYIYFGNDADRVANGAVGATVDSVQAMITVDGGTTGRTEFFILGGDPAGGINVPFTGVLPVDVPIGGPAGKIVVDPAFAVDSFFDVFFDVEFAQDASTDLAGLIALLEGQGLTVGPGRMLPSSGPGGIPYDFSLHIPAPDMGGSLVLDFDFGAMGTTGVSVNSVAVPEPSSVAIAALGLVGLLALRRRKA